MIQFKDVFLRAKELNLTDSPTGFVREILKASGLESAYDPKFLPAAESVIQSYVSRLAKVETSKPTFIELLNHPKIQAAFDRDHQSTRYCDGTVVTWARATRNYRYSWLAGHLFKPSGRHYGAQAVRKWMKGETACDRGRVAEQLLHFINHGEWANQPILFS